MTIAATKITMYGSVNSRLMKIALGGLKCSKQFNERKEVITTLNLHPRTRNSRPDTAIELVPNKYEASILCNAKSSYLTDLSWKSLKEAD